MATQPFGADTTTGVMPTPVEARVTALAQAVADALTAADVGAATPTDISTAITALGLGTAATHPTSDFATPSSVSSAVSAEATARATAITSAINTLTTGAPGLLDTLAEIDAAIGNDPSYATTVTTALATKVNSSTYTSGLALKADLASPTFTGTVSGVTKTMVGLGNVDNTSDASKPVSTAQAAADALKANIASPTFTGTVGGISKSMVGLGSVDNTADTAKPVSTAQQTALDAKAAIVETVNTVAASGTAVTLPDVTTATIHDVTLTGNCTFTFPTVAAGKSFTVRLTQDATGSRTATWPATVKWPSGTAPTLSTAATKADILTFVSIGGTTWSGFLAGLDLR